MTTDEWHKMVTMIDFMKETEFMVHPDFYKADVDKIVKLFNGCGPEWLPAPIRKWLDAHFHEFKEAFVPHDFSFAQVLCKCERCFHAANDRLYHNMLMIIEKHMKWHQTYYAFGFIPIPCWRKIRAKRQAYVIYKACEAFGFSAFQEGGLDD